MSDTAECTEQTQEIDSTMHQVAVIAYVGYLAYIQPWTLSTFTQGHMLLAGFVGMAIGAQLVLLAERDVL